MKKDLKYIFDEADDGELEAFLEKHPAADLSDKDLSSVKRRVYEKIGQKTSQTIGETPEKQKRKKRSALLLRRTLTAAACVCLAVITVLAVLPRLNGITPPTPGGDGTPTADTPTGTKAPDEPVLPSGKISLSNPKSYDELYGIFSEMFDNIKDTVVDEGSASTPGNTIPSENSSQSIIDNQTSGIEEADIIKRTDKYIFHTYIHFLTIYSIEGEASKRVARIEWTQFIEDKKWGAKEASGIFISDDGKTLTILAQAHDVYGKQPYDPVMLVLILDVSDLEDIKCVRTVILSGAYKDARMVDDKILLFTEQFIRYDDPGTMVPETGDCGKMEKLPLENIFYPSEPETRFSQYTTISLVDVKGVDETQAVSIFGFSGEPYVSSDNIYMTRRFYERLDSSSESVMKTEIVGVSFGDGELEVNSTVTVDGAIKDRFSLDEYNGILRVVTNPVKLSSVNDSVKMSDVVTLFTFSSANLYCFDSVTLEKRAEILRFAPDNETVQSVRFDRDKAYVCTAEVSWNVLDPVFFFDLSDLDNITYTDTGTIPGLSTALIYFGDGKLVGIGEEDGLLKLEAYEEKDGKVVSVSKHIENYTWYSKDYKTYCIDRENGYIGLKVKKSAQNNSSIYLLLKFDGEKFEKIKTANIFYQNERAFVADGYLYVVSHVKIDAIKLD